MRVVRFAFPFAWMAVILWLASDSGSAEHTGQLILPVLHALFPAATPIQLDAMHAFLRKVAHVTEYAVLAGLWIQAVGRHHGRRALRAWLIATGWAIVDETFQSRVGSRTASVFDVALD